MSWRRRRAPRTGPPSTDPRAGAPVSMLRRAQLQELLVDRLDRDGEADALRPLQHQGVDADHLTVLPDQRAAAVAGIDRRVGLQEPLLTRTAIAGENSRRHAVGKSGGVADGVQAFPLGERARVPGFEVWTVIGGQLKDRQ